MQTEEQKWERPENEAVYIVHARIKSKLCAWFLMMFQIISPIDAHHCHNVCKSLHVLLLPSILCHVSDLGVRCYSINTYG